MNDFLKRASPIIKNPKYLIIAGLVGIMLIALSSLFSSDKKESSPKTEVGEDYRVVLQEEISDMVNKITGKKDADVVITLDSTPVCSYAETKEQNKKSQSETESQSSTDELKEGYVTVKTDDGGEKALVVTEQMPEVRGVAIVCSGGDNEEIQNKIQSTVTAALGITKKRVYICGRNSQ